MVPLFVVPPYSLAVSSNFLHKCDCSVLADALSCGKAAVAAFEKLSTTLKSLTGLPIPIATVVPSSPGANTCGCLCCISSLCLHPTCCSPSPHVCECASPSSTRGRPNPFGCVHRHRVTKHPGLRCRPHGMPARACVRLLACFFKSSLYTPWSVCF